MEECLGERGKDFVEDVQCKVSPGDYKQIQCLKYGEHRNMFPVKPKPNCIRVIYYVSNSFQKLRCATLRSQKILKIKHASKMIFNELFVQPKLQKRLD